MPDRADNFNRSNASTLGTPSDAGSAWVQPNAGLWHISGNAAKAIECDDGETYGDAMLAVLETSSASGDVSVKQLPFDSYYGENYTGIAFRVSSGTNAPNHLRFAANESASYLKKVTGLTPTTLGTGAGAPANATLSVTISGNSITCKVNGSTVITATESFNNDQTRHGLFSSIGTFFTPGAGPTHDDFAFTEPVSIISIGASPLQVEKSVGQPVVTSGVKTRPSPDAVVFTHSGLTARSGSLAFVPSNLAEASLGNFGAFSGIVVRASAGVEAGLVSPQVSYGGVIDAPPVSAEVVRNGPVVRSGFVSFVVPLKSEFGLGDLSSLNSSAVYAEGSQSHLLLADTFPSTGVVTTPPPSEAVFDLGVSFTSVTSGGRLTPESVVFLGGEIDLTFGQAPSPSPAGVVVDSAQHEIRIGGTAFVPSSEAVFDFAILITFVVSEAFISLEGVVFTVTDVELVLSNKAHLEVESVLFVASGVELLDRSVFVESVPAFGSLIPPDSVTSSVTQVSSSEILFWIGTTRPFTDRLRFVDYLTGVLPQETEALSGTIPQEVDLLSGDLQGPVRLN